MKKLIMLALVCSFGMSYAAKVRMVTLTAREIEMVKRAHELVVQQGKKALSVATYVQRIAQGEVTMSREERDELMHQVMFLLSRDAKQQR